VTLGIQSFDIHDTFNIATYIDVGSYSDTMTLFNALTRPYRIDQILVSSDDTVDHTFTYIMSPPDSGSASLGTVTIPAGAGWDPAIPPIDLLPALCPTLDHISLIPGDQPECIIGTVISGGKSVRVAFIGGYF
jgi:hypothetical protein